MMILEYPLLFEAEEAKHASIKPETAKVRCALVYAELVPSIVI